MQCWQVQLQVITRCGKRSSATGIPTFHVFATDIEGAIGNVRAIAMGFVKQEPNATTTLSGTVCAAERAKLNGYGSIFGLFDKRGDGYRAFELPLFDSPSDAPPSDAGLGNVTHG